MSTVTALIDRNLTAGHVASGKRVGWVDGGWAEGWDGGKGMVVDI